MYRNCLQCGGENIKLVPAGVSRKSGKPYREFYSCQDCKHTWNPNPKRGEGDSVDEFKELMYILREIKTQGQRIEDRLKTLVPNPKLDEPDF